MGVTYLQAKALQPYRKEKQWIHKANPFIFLPFLRDVDKPPGKETTNSLGNFSTVSHFGLSDEAL